MSFSLHRVKQRCRRVTELAIALIPLSVDRISNKSKSVNHNPVLLSSGHLSHVILLFLGFEPKLL